ncbi:MAG: hypothetical protein SOW25_07000 [Helicobacter sp.]|nr:hypothetical protein [Helicobacteraceae bacterium]MDY3114056.1 hypothetical protein [Helicobacter sp.]
MQRILKKIENFLIQRNRREIILLSIICFACGWILFFNTLSDFSDKLEFKKTQLVALQNEILTLENHLNTKLHLQNNLKPLQSLQNAINTMQTQIRLQEQQIESLNQKFGIYFLDEIARKNSLKDLKIIKENEIIFLEAKANFNNLSAFFNSFLKQSNLEIKTLFIYPNLEIKMLEIYSNFAPKNTNFLREQ